MNEPMTTPQPEERAKIPIGCCNCGLIPHLKSQPAKWYQYVCSRCDTRGPRCPTEPEALELWSGMRGAYRTCPGGAR